ncbi:hypothetical protein N2152v2_008050 [Parachlorella kessleri]
MAPSSPAWTGMIDGGREVAAKKQVGPNRRSSSSNSNKDSQGLTQQASPLPLLVLECPAPWGTPAPVSTVAQTAAIEAFRRPLAAREQPPPAQQQEPMPPEATSTVNTFNLGMSNHLEGLTKTNSLQEGLHTPGECLSLCLLDTRCEFWTHCPAKLADGHDTIKRPVGVNLAGHSADCYDIGKDDFVISLTSQATCEAPAANPGKAVEGSGSSVDVTEAQSTFLYAIQAGGQEAVDGVAALMYAQSQLKCWEGSAILNVLSPPVDKMVGPTFEAGIVNIVQ